MSAASASAFSLRDRLVDGGSRQQPLLERIRASGRPVQMYGAGVYAYVLRRYLAACGIEPAGVIVDAAWRQADRFMGLPVRTTEESVAELDRCHVVVGIVNHPPCVRRLQALGARDVHAIDVPDYLNMPQPFMDRAFVVDRLAEFERAGAAFADELSRETYVALINAKIAEDPGLLASVVRRDRLYFPAEFPVGEEAVLIDVGGYTGDTVREFHALAGGRYRRIVSLEPDEGNFAALQATIGELGAERVLAVPLGAWDERATLRLAPCEMNIDNRIAADGTRAIEVDTLDAIIDRAGVVPTLVKLDINGAEYRALCGAGRILRQHRPRVVTRLHTREDLYRIPLLLAGAAPGMRLYLRQRDHMSMMAVLYAVPG